MAVASSPNGGIFPITLIRLCASENEKRVTLSLPKGLPDCGSLSSTSCAGYERDHTVIGKILRLAALAQDDRNKGAYASLRMSGGYLPHSAIGASFYHAPNNPFPLHENEFFLAKPGYLC